MFCMAFFAVCNFIAVQQINSSTVNLAMQAIVHNLFRNLSPGGSTIVTNFTRRHITVRKSNFIAGCLFIYNIATISGQQINATVTVESIELCHKWHQLRY